MSAGCEGERVVWGRLGDATMGSGARIGVSRSGFDGLRRVSKSGQFRRDR